MRILISISLPIGASEEGETGMYQIIETAGSFQVVYAINGGKTVVRVLNTYASRADAQKLLSDLAGWVL